MICYVLRPTLLLLFCCLLVSQHGSEQREQYRQHEQSEVTRWYLEHAQWSAEQERLNKQRADTEAARQWRECAAVGESLVLHIRLYIHSRDQGVLVDVSTQRERKLWRDLHKRFDACDK